MPYKKCPTTKDIAAFVEKKRTEYAEFDIEKILSDQESQFKSNEWLTYCTRHSIEVVNTSAYYPEETE
jgi:hypothetical protein